MNQNFLPHNVLQMPYRAIGYDAVYLGEGYARERFFSAVASNDTDELAEIAKNLSEIYGVTDRESMQGLISSYNDNVFFSSVALSLFYEAYLVNDSRLKDLSFREFEGSFLTKERVKQVLAGLKISEEKFDEYLSDLSGFISGYFFGEAKGEQNKMAEILDFIVQTKEIFALCPKSGISGFDVARIIQIVTDSYALNYINKTEFEELFEEFGCLADERFGGFDEYIASFLLGRAYMLTDEEGELKEKLEERANVFMLCLNSPYDMFKASGLWSENLEAQKDRAKKLLLNFVDEAELTRQKNEMSQIVEEISVKCALMGYEIKDFINTLDEFYEYFIDRLKEQRADGLLRNEAAGTFFITPLDELYGVFSLYEYAKKFCDKHSVKLDAGEYPVMFSDDFSKTLITNKAIYKYGGFWFFKKLTRVEWKDAISNVRLDPDAQCAVFTYQASPKLTVEIRVTDYVKKAGKKLNISELANETAGLRDAFKSLKEHFSRA